MSSIKLPSDQVFWHLQATEIVRLQKDTHADVVIVGGGMSGLSAAQRFREKGCSVIVIEKTTCGAAASGKSSGFIAPDSEFSLNSFLARFGPKSARLLWDFVCGGVERIRNSIEQSNISCDYQVQDALVVAHTSKEFLSTITNEHNTRKHLGYESTLYNAHELTKVLGSNAYFGGVRYGDTFSMNGFQYLRGLKEVLKSDGVQVYEETPAISIEPNLVRTPHGVIKAKYVVLCTDKSIPELDKLTHEISSVQTFLMISAPLTKQSVQSLFPEKPLMVWDTDLIYQYYRLTGDKRLLLGGSSITATYANQSEPYKKGIFRKLTSYFEKNFPNVDVEFQYMWPGRIGMSKDVMPIAGRDQDNPALYYIAAPTGLPWAAALGAYSADVLIEGRNDLDEYFSPYRSFPFGHFAQHILGKRLTFALSHLRSVKSF